MAQLRMAFSVRRVLFFTAIIALTVSQVSLLWRNSALNAEIAILHRETGRLAIVDHDKINLINVPTNDPLIHKWRIYAPPGTCFDGGIETQSIPQHGVTDANFSGMPIDLAETGSLVTTSITQGLDGEYNLAISFQNGNVFRSKTTLAPKEWLEGTSSRMVAGATGVSVYDYDEPIILFRVRLMEQANHTPRHGQRGEARGTLMWIVPRKSP